MDDLAEKMPQAGQEPPCVPGDCAGRAFFNAALVSDARKEAAAVGKAHGDVPQKGGGKIPALHHRARADTARRLSVCLFVRTAIFARGGNALGIVAAAQPFRSESEGMERQRNCEKPDPTEGRGTPKEKMKGVIVQVGNPKSIVLFNNGKISAIPTPAEAHVGMVVTVKLNGRVKIVAIAAAVALVLVLGIGIGLFVAKGGKEQKHGQYADGQRVEQTQKESDKHDTSGYSFQKGKEENRTEE